LSPLGRDRLVAAPRRHRLGDRRAHAPRRQRQARHLRTSASAGVCLLVAASGVPDGCVTSPRRPPRQRPKVPPSRSNGPARAYAEGMSFAYAPRGSGTVTERRPHHGVDVLGLHAQQSWAGSARDEVALGDPSAERSDTYMRARRRLAKRLIRLPGHRLLPRVLPST